MNLSKLRGTTKGLLGAVLVAASLFQAPAVHDALILLAHDHPHILGVIGALTVLGTLLHDPQVKEALDGTSGDK